ncbi:similar to Saccharomyces cerevisiae YGR220C MRPL9 Mitochondrial ribosomal protein of the large subunit [Maudiozyma barnettii]|uniref:Large ribosomal subunit protein uL3m n=1 Tax=Maudiozyma barnettii TaxID=61262 RepID=A0A8H2VIL2_9SACH|nr:mitochondrial 54S ribosomal protein YmL9 [Kazachstania barnettii]CAB4256101.1 similar to Saccharomyces cerevisiae YGR220C MRPL9 Mitochondrial ribosomal protein of the large subunit [Kazachstania barnettii]CAD1784709.1 similar to Saccharomyces cerevisiae YGR220C MRPL9 Mitochondrial ribosomal protein of the large subunit [Kazachstania barnettii]
MFPQNTLWAGLAKPISSQYQLSNILRLYSTRPSLIAPSVASTVHSVAPEINHSPIQAFKRKWLPKRCGIITEKVGMMPYFDTKTGDRLAATILKLDNVEVMMHRTIDSDGYFACQVGYGNKNPKNVSRQLLGHYASKIVNPKLKTTEFKVANEEGLLPLGTLMKPSFFEVGQFLDVRSVSKGKGFAGVMKKYHFKGLRASHGTSIMHRHGGSYGQNQDPGRVLPGKKMPGRMGGINVTVQNVEVLKIDDVNNVIWVKGAVPGPNGSIVKIQDSIKKPPA